jgi:hypothetical protein
MTQQGPHKRVSGLNKWSGFFVVSEGVLNYLTRPVMSKKSARQGVENAANGGPFTRSTTQTGGFLTITLRTEVSGPGLIIENAL